MLDKYLGDLQEMAGGLMKDNNLDPNQSGELINAGAESLQENLIGKAMGGNMDGVLGFLNGKDDDSNSFTDGITKSFVEKISSKLGLDGAMASGLASSFVPMIIDMIRRKFTDSDGDNDESNMTDFLGLDAGGIMDKAKDLLGGKLGGLFS